METLKQLIFNKLQILIVMGICVCQSISHAQHVNLNQNSANARISNNGLFFNSSLSGDLGYEMPAGEGTNLIYSASMWFGGILPNSDLAVAAMRYGQDGSDFWPGPIATNYNDPDYVSNFSTSIWSFEEGEIELYRTWWETCSGPSADANACASLMPAQIPSITLMDKINNWPAHGNVANGEAKYLAPFVDYNNDEEYNPADGDYPKLKGCSGTYVILNDVRDVHTESGGAPLGIEIHYTFYQYASTDDVDSTTFLDVQVFNRSTNSIEDFTSALFFDGDLGGSNDDYVGCDISRNLGYYYNGDFLDESVGPTIGYGPHPPAFGIKALNVTMSSFMYFSNGSAFPLSDPTIAIHYWNAMNGRFQDGSQMHYGGNGYSVGATTIPTNYVFPGNSDPLHTATGGVDPGFEWTEVQANRPFGDRRALMGFKVGDFDPTIDEYETTTSKKMSFAVIYSRASTISSLFGNVNTLRQTADFIQDFYDNQNLECANNIAGLDNLEQSNIKLYPNPATNNVLIAMDSEEMYQGKIMSITGKEVHSFSTTGKSTNIDCSKLESGMYILQLTDGSKTISKQFVKAD